MTIFEKILYFCAQVTLWVFLMGIPLSIFYTSRFGLVGNILGAYFTRMFLEEFRDAIKFRK